MRTILFLLLLLTGCQPMPQECADAFHLLRTFSAKQKQENQLEPFGIGGSMFDSIKILSLDLVSHQMVDITEARRLYVTGTEELLQMINESPKLRPYLHHYPFTIEDLEYAILFKDCNSEFYPPPHIALVTVIRGKIYYKMHDPATQRFVEAYVESYGEALKRIREKSCSIH